MNVALPSIQSGLHASRAAVQLIIAGYGLTFATGMIAPVVSVTVPRMSAVVLCAAAR